MQRRFYKKMLANDKIRARSDSFKIDDDYSEEPAMKKMKDLKELKDISDSSSEDTTEDDKLQRMTQAMKTIIEVSHPLPATLPPLDHRYFISTMHFIVHGGRYGA